MAKTKKNAQGKNCLSRGPLSSLKFFTTIKKTPSITGEKYVATHKNDTPFLFFDSMIQFWLMENHHPPHSLITEKTISNLVLVYLNH